MWASILKTSIEYELLWSKDTPINTLPVNEHYLRVNSIWHGGWGTLGSGPQGGGTCKIENVKWAKSFCPALTKLTLDLHVNFCLFVCLSVCLSVFPVFFSRRLIGWYTGFWQWFCQPTYPCRCSELGWAVPHSDFLAWLSSATLKNFISGVSRRILMR